MLVSERGLEIITHGQRLQSFRDFFKVFLHGGCGTPEGEVKWPPALVPWRRRTLRDGERAELQSWFTVVQLHFGDKKESQRGVYVWVCSRHL